MNRRLKRICAIVACLVFTSPVFGGVNAAAATGEARPQGSGPNAATDPRDLLPAGAMTLSMNGSSADASTPNRPPGEIFRAVGDLRSPQALDEALRELVETKWRLKLPELRRLAAEANARAAEASSDEWTFRVGTPAGDLTGDGLEDTVIYEVTVNVETEETVSFRIRGSRGTDAARLWSIDLSDAFVAYVLPAGDLSGDGADDILLLELAIDGEETGGCVPLLCAARGEFSFSWTLSLVGGRNGATLWSKQLDGTVEDTFASASSPVAFAAAEAYTVTNALALPLVSDDHNDDGNNDIVLNAFDVTALLASQDVSVPTASVVELYVLIATRADVLAGVDGESFFARSQDYVPGGAVLEPSGAAVGNAREDLLWQTITDIMSPVACVDAVVDVVCGSVEKSSIALEMIDGDGLNSSWKATIADADLVYGFAIPAHRDLTGDGSDDLLLLEVRGRLAADVSWGAASGKDGSVLWRRPSVDVSFAFAMGPAGGQPGSDVGILELRFEATSPEIVLTFTRVDGPTGEVLRTTSRTYLESGGEALLLSAYPFGDGDADGVTDVAIFTNKFGFFTGQTSSNIVESGATGVPIFSRSSKGFAVAAPAGDQNAAGGDDLLMVSLAFTRREARVKIAAIRLPAGSTAWLRRDDYPPLFAFTLLPSADQSGAGGDDIIYSRAQVRGRTFASRVDGLEARTGTRSWGYGPSLARRG